jgi:hypothetical protein
MNYVHIVYADQREGDGRLISAHTSKTGAIRAVQEYVRKRYGSDRDIKDMEDAYSGNLAEGIFHSEDESIYIITTHLKGDDEV